MVTQSPIEGNLDCRARSFHSELCFDRETFRHQPELKDSFHLLQRYHLEHLMTLMDFFYPRVALDFYQSMTTHRIRDPTVIHFTIDGRHGILGARHIVEVLYIPYEPVSPADYRENELPPGMLLLDVVLRSNIFPLQHMRRSTRRSYREQMSFHYFFLGCLCQILEHLVPTLEATSSAPPITPETPPVVPTTSTPPPSESTITISASKFRGLCHTLQTLTTTQSVLAQQIAVIRAHQDQLIATQTQYAAILRQIHQNLGILSPPEHDMPGPSELTDPSQEAPLVEQTVPHEETTTIEVETPIQSTQTTTAEPSSPHDPPTIA
ncbi:hypothetical protein CK203_106413 [Vitis vinifera]|uniref:Uncharacterized protein n=1 Tax=Vitis vinifera TaxID=29760 RepID=A0A438CRV6_VITVI|nr:hypothetical protein CK203_106413 [Vitis vinifera]